MFCDLVIRSCWGTHRQRREFARVTLMWIFQSSHLNTRALCCIAVVSCAVLIYVFASVLLGPRRPVGISQPPRASADFALHSRPTWVYDVGYHESKKYSQNGEDGVIEFIFSNIGTLTKYYVEFGVETGIECNTRNLREHHGWSGLLMDGAHEVPHLNLRKEIILPSNVVSLFQKHDVPAQFDLLSVDTDMLDYWILQKLLMSAYTPRVIIVEVNAKIVAGASLVVPYSETPVYWSGTDFFGASIAAFSKLGQRFNYTMVYCESMGVNCFLVHDSLLGGSMRHIFTPALLYKPPRYGAQLCGHKASGKINDFVKLDLQDHSHPAWYSIRCT